MAIRSSRYFNDPAIAQAAANLTAMFSPPSGSDASAWATASAKRDEAARLAQLFQNAGSDTFDQNVFDRQAAALGVYHPTQGFGARDMADSAKRYGIDVGAATSRANTDATNRTNFLGKLYRPLSPGETRPEVAGDIAAMYGLPGVTVPETRGTPKPMSETEWRAAVLGELPEPEQRAAALGSTPVENVVTPEGPRTVFRADAVGQEPFFNKGSEAKPVNGMAVLPDGAQVPAVQDAQSGRWRHAQTGEELPADIRVFDTPRPQGTSEEVGVSKPTNSRIEQKLIDITTARNTAVRLRDMIAESPASQGMVGWMRGTAQNVIQTGGELGQFFGGGMQEVAEAINSNAADAGLAGAFDPNIPAIEMMANLLAFQYAKTTTGERLSNEMLRNAKEALGLVGLTANQASSLTRLDQAIKLIDDQAGILNQARTGGVGSLARPAPASTAGPQPGHVEDGFVFRGGDPADPANWERAQ